MNEHLRDIPLDFSKWELYGTVEPFKIEGSPVPGLKQDCYQIEINGELISAGVFEYKGKRTHIAWGVKSQAHCSFHKLVGTDGSWCTTKDGCPEYGTIKYEENSTGFTIDGNWFSL